MSEPLPPQWTRLRDGARFVGDLWPPSDEHQRREILVSALMSGAVRMRARYAARPRHPDGRPMLPSLERRGALGTITPLPDVPLLLRMDSRLVTWDFSAGRVVICPIYDDKSSWGLINFEPHFPGGATVATGRFLSVELDDIEFDGTAARAYIVENLLPVDATPNAAAAAKPKPLDSAPPEADGNVIQFPYRTGAPGRPTSWDNLVLPECRRRHGSGERYPDDRTGIESPAKWARVLIAWLSETHKGAAVPKEKTLTNKLGALLRELATSAPPPAS